MNRSGNLEIQDLRERVAKLEDIIRGHVLEIEGRLIALEGEKEDLFNREEDKDA